MYESILDCGSKSQRHRAVIYNLNDDLREGKSEPCAVIFPAINLIIKKFLGSGNSTINLLPEYFIY